MTIPYYILMYKYPNTMKYDNIKGIIFDYDGTVDIRGDRWAEVMLDAFRSNGIEVSLPALKHTAEAVGTYLITDNLIQPTDDFTSMMRTCARLMLQRLAGNYQIGARFTDTPDTADAIARYCLDYMNATFEVDRPVVAALAERFPLVLVSRHYPNFGAMLDEFGLSPYFRQIIQSRHTGTDAGDGDIIRRGVEALGLPASDILVIGGSLRSDIGPALAQGCHALWIADKSRAGDAPDGVGVAGSLRAALKLI